MEITFFCYNCLVNNTDQRIVVLDSSKKPLAGQSSSSYEVVPLSRQQKVHFALERGRLSSPCVVNVPGLTSKLQLPTATKGQMDFVLRTNVSTATEDDDLYVKVTTIDPAYVAVNNSGMHMVIAQEGQTTRSAEVVPPGGRLCLYKSDAKGKPRIRFKFSSSPAEDDRLADFEWSRPIKLAQVGRISIHVRNAGEIRRSKHVRVVKQVPNNSQTLFIIFSIEEEASPTYRIDNQSRSILLELTQHGITPVSDQLIISYRPGSKDVFSWTDPE
jgi:hypothetical protein